MIMPINDRWQPMTDDNECRINNAWLKHERWQWMLDDDDNDRWQRMSDK